ncbi:MAG: hypothetical protein ACODAQ_13325 [Phycisphaeraceae bacterium]
MANQYDKRKQTGSIFATPGMIVVLGLLLWIASAAAAMVATVGLEWVAVDQMDQVTTLALTYGAYLPSVLLGLLGTVVLIVGAVRAALYGRSARTVPTEAERRELLALLRQANDRLLLSEPAKRIAYREHDIQTLRRVIEQDITRGDFDAAMILIEELAHTYGRRHEAEGYRERIANVRQQDQQAKIDEAVQGLEQILAQHEFDRAAREAAKLQRLFPDAERVQSLDQRVRDAREQYKQQLERQFLEAAESDDVDRALELLKELDMYLTEQEAEPLRETARGVIGKKRDNLGVQFKMAVHDKEWLRAVQVGEQIIREFPNSRMAEEARGMIDVLRQRAGEQHAASVTYFEAE